MNTRYLVMTTGLVAALLLAAMIYGPSVQSAGAASTVWEEFRGTMLAPRTRATGAEQPGLPAPAEPNAPAQAVPLFIWRNMRPTRNLLMDVSMVEPEQSVNAEQYYGFAVGGGGVTLGYQNGIWDHVNRATDNMLWAVEVRSPILAFACGEQGDIEQYGYRPLPIDGLVWQDLSVGGGFSGDLYSISMGSDSDGWAVGADGGMVHGVRQATYSGRYEYYSFSWSPVMTVTTSDLNGVKMFSASEGWAVGGVFDLLNLQNNKGTVAHYSGGTWSASDVGTQMLIGVDGVSANDLWAVGANGTILHCNGSSWQSASSPTTEHLRRVEMVSASEGWASGDDGTLLHYTGGAWQLADDVLYTDRDLSLRGMDFASGQGWMVGEWGLINKLRDDGTWVSVTSPTNNDLYSVWTLTYDDAWAVGDDDDDGATILHWNGDVWERVFYTDMDMPAAGLRTIEMVSEGEGWTMGEPVGSPPSALTMRYDGVRWYEPLKRSPSENTIQSLDMAADTLGWAVGDDNHSTLLYQSVQDEWVGLGTCTADIYDFQSVGVGISMTVPPTPASPLAWDAWAAGIDYGTGGGLLLCDELNPQVWLHFEQCGIANRFNPTWSYTPMWCGTGVVGGVATRKPSIVNEIALTDYLHGYAVGYTTEGNARYWRYDGYAFQKPSPVQDEVWPVLGTDDPCPAGRGPSRFNGAHSFWAGSPLTATLWIGGYGSCITPYADESAWLAYYDPDGGLFNWGGPTILPYAMIPPPGLWHEPVNDIRMVDETQGWAVGEHGYIYMYPFPNFTLVLEPESRGVRPSGTAVYEVRAHGVISGSAFTIQLTPTLSSALSPHATVDLSSSAIEPNESASLTVTVGSGAPLGSHEVRVQGTATVTTHEFLQTTVMRQDTSELYVTNNPIYSITPQRGPAGTQVTINGENFGASPGSVLFNGQTLPGGSIQSWSSSQIRVVMPDSLTIAPLGGVEAPIRVQASDLSNGVDFILEPHITSLSAGLVSVGDTVMIYGTTFGPDPTVGYRSTGLYNVTINDVKVPDSSITGWSNNQITFIVPYGATSGAVVVTSNGWESNDDQRLRVWGGALYLPLVLRQS